jgi:glycosyltransferase involved in cell wall biosynthesis
MLIGTGELLDNLRRIAAVGPAASNSHFLGMRCDARRLLGLADIYVHGCCVEGFGLAVVEAMLAARPVVVPRGGAVMEYIEDGKNGMVYNPGDPADLANAVMKLAANREQAVKIGSAARDYCLHAFAPQQWGQSVFAFIERVQPAAVARIRTSPAFPADAQTQPELSCAS